MDKGLVWRTREKGTERKGKSWYWAIAILSLGGAVASIIAANILLAILILFGGFAVMVAGSLPRVERRFALSDRGIHVDTQLVEWKKVTGFAMREDDEPELVLRTETFSGTITLPLSGINHREVRTELKNRNIDEFDSLDTFTESITRALGLW